MKKICFLFGCLGIMLALSGCVSARETQNPQPRKAVICSAWDKSGESQIDDQKESRKPDKARRGGKSGKRSRRGRGNRRNNQAY